MSPHSSHHLISFWSECVYNFSCKHAKAPCATMQSFSISPTLSPPPAALPADGCPVIAFVGPYVPLA